VQHILFTHFHADHFHPESFPLLNKDADVIVPVTAGGYLCRKAREEGFTRAREIRAEQPLRLNELEVHALRIHDHWEFLDETAYLVVENDTAALFLADLWYMPPALLARVRQRYRLAFASLPWGGNIENLCVMPRGYELDAITDYYRYGMEESTLARRNAVVEHCDLAAIAATVDADCMTPGSFGFGWIAPDDEFVKPLPVNRWLDQEAFIASLPDSPARRKLQPMYPGDCYDSANGAMRRHGSPRPNHPATHEMRARTLAMRDSTARLDPDHIQARALGKIDEALRRFNDSSQFYRERLLHLLSAEYQFEIRLVNDARQMFLFEQKGSRFTVEPIDKPTGVKEFMYMPPAVLSRILDNWGPMWTDANFSMLVKVSARGWAPYKLLSIYFG
jgi:hypothetical protein